MRVRVLFFGALKEIFGGENEEIELPEDANVACLKRLLEERVTGHDDLLGSIAIAVNREYARAEDSLHEGDEVALLPPVSGGLR
jgi:sulfur-carrier protein